MALKPKLAVGIVELLGVIHCPPPVTQPHSQPTANGTARTMTAIATANTAIIFDFVLHPPSNNSLTKI
jgi:hypothetical protein